MEQYIEKSALVAEIRKRLLPVIRDKHYDEWEEGQHENVCYSTDKRAKSGMTNNRANEDKKLALNATAPYHRPRSLT